MCASLVQGPDIHLNFFCCHHPTMIVIVYTISYNHQHFFPTVNVIPTVPKAMEQEVSVYPGYILDPVSRENH